LLVFDDVQDNIEAFDEYTFFKLDSCISNGYDFESKGILYTMQLRFFVFENSIVTYCSQGHECVEIISEAIARVKPYDDFVCRCLFFMIDCIFENFDEELTKMQIKIDKMEDRVGDSYVEGVIPIVKTIKKKWTLLDNLVERQKYSFRPSRLSGIAFRNTAIIKSLNNIYDNMESISKQLTNLKDNMREISNVYANILQCDMNKTIFILTVVAVVFSPLQFLMGYYGVNIVGLPYLQHPYTIWVVTVFSILFMIGGVLWGYKKYQKTVEPDE